MLVTMNQFMLGLTELDAFDTQCFQLELNERHLELQILFCKQIN